MAKILFITVYWFAFFLLRAFFRDHGLGIDPNSYNLIGSALFLSLIIIYALISSFLRAYLRGSETRIRNKRQATSEAEETTINNARQAATKIEPGAARSPVAKPDNPKQSRVRVLRGNQND